MSDSERYMLIFSLVIFFGMMSLGLMIIHGSSLTNKSLNDLVLTQEQAISALNRDISTQDCYTGEKLASFIAGKKEQGNFVHFLKSNTGENGTLDIYLNASPEGAGDFFIIENKTDGNAPIEGCVIAEGNTMKIVVNAPETDAPMQPSATEAEAIEDVVEEVAEEVVEDVVEKAIEEVPTPTTEETGQN